MATIFETLTTLSNIVTDAITAGNDTNIPDKIVRNTLIRVSTGKYYEVLPIVVPAECCILGDELRSTNVQARTALNAQLTPAEDFNYSFYGFNRLEEIIGDIAAGRAISPTTGNTLNQITTWPYAETNPPHDSSKKLVRSIKRRIDVSLGNKKEVIFPNYYDMTTPANGEARDLLKLNKKFIQAEIVAFLADENNYPTLAYSKTKCKKDVGFIIDAVSYDLSYGGNWQSVLAGEAYYEGANFNIISTSERQATIDVYTYIKIVMQQIVANTVVVGYQSTETQILEVGLDGTTAASTIGNLIDNIIDIVTNGSGTVAITYPSLIGIDSRYTSVSSTLVNLKETVKTNTIDFINSHFGSFSYNSAKCRRDLDFIITDTAYDIVLGTNYNSVVNGRSYRRGNAVYNLTNEREATVGAIRYVRDRLKVLAIADGSTNINQENEYTNKIQVSYNEIVDIINNNTPDAIAFATHDGIPQTRIDTSNELNLDRIAIRTTIINYVAATYPALVYDQAKCERDINYIIDALRYDLLYTTSGNTVTHATVRAAESYFVDGVLQAEIETADAYVYFRDTVLDAQLTTVTDHITELKNRLTIIINAINGSAIPSPTFPDISWQTDDYQTVFNSINNAKANLIVDTVQFITDNYNDFIYNHAKCSRDLGYIIDAARYDFMFKTNFASMQAAYSYLRSPSKKVIGNQKTATIAANEYARQYLFSQIQANTLTVPKYWYNFDYNEATCERDTKILIDSIRYDFVFGTNWQSITSANRYYSGVTATEKVLTQQLQQTLDSLEKAKELTLAEIVDSGVKTTVTNLWDTIITIVGTGYQAVDTADLTVPAGGTGNAFDTFYLNARNQLIANKIYLQDEIDAWIADSVANGTNGFSTNFTYNAAKCRRDVGYIIDAVIYDLNYGGNTQTKDAAEAYYSYGQAQYGVGEKSATIAAFGRLKTIIGQVIVETDITESPGNNTLQDTTGSAGNTTSANAAEALIQIIIDYITNDAGSAITAVYPDVTNENATLQTEFNNLPDATQTTIASETTDWITTQIILAGISNTWEWIEDIVWSGASEGGTRQTDDFEVYNALRQLELNKEFIVEEVLNYVDKKFTNEIISLTQSNGTDPGFLSINDTSHLFVGMPIKFRNKDDSADVVTQSGLDADTTYFVRQIKSDTDLTISLEKFGPVFFLPDFAGGSFELYMGYYYNRRLCARDVREYINSIKWDLTWPQDVTRIYNKYGFNVRIDLPAFYKSSLAARYYVNSVIGSQEEDMYYLRNGTGLRMMTLDGLRGDLGPANSYGTQRPTAGAYASLDPGWGPDDSRCWITARSPYVQNCTTFGYGAVGQKIDGALHNGGNDSIVSNDFTQVISDGIGAWLLNNGRAELVSVFTYYSHIGYLSESGGRMRATNGNNSYGKFGSVAEGVDAEENPVTAIVDNEKQYNATISAVFTDAADEIWQLEYANAGNDYTKAKMNFFGPGDSIISKMEEFRDEAVHQVRVIEVDDSTGNPDATAGGEGYTIVSNTAQDGTDTTLQLAATDGNVSSTYFNNKVLIIGGAGVGAFGFVKTYNAGNKQMDIVRKVREVSASEIVSSSVYMIYDVGTTTNWSSIGAGAINFVGEIFTASGTVTGDGKAYLMTAGWDHVISGTVIDLSNNPNSSSTYIIEPNLEFYPPSRSHTTRTSLAAATYSDLDYFTTTAEYTNVSVTTGSDGVGATFDIVRFGEKYYISINASGSGYSRLDTLTILGTSLGGSSVNNIIVTVTAVNTSTGAINDFDFSGYGQRGMYLALPSNNGATVYHSATSETWSSTALSSTSNWKRTANGVLDDGSTTFAPSWAVAVGASAGVTTITRSTDGLTWLSPLTPQINYQLSVSVNAKVDIAFGAISFTNIFIMIADDDQAISQSFDGGDTWTRIGNALPTGVGWDSIAFGEHRFIALKSGTRDIAYSDDGGYTWLEGTSRLPNDGNGNEWCDLTYGKGRWVAVSSTSTMSAYSYDNGTTWTSSTMLTGSGTNYARRISYGQGTFAVTTTSTTNPYVAYSENGVNWQTPYQVTDTLTTGLDAIIFANPNRIPQFVALGTDGLSEIKLGCTTQARASIASEKFYEARITEPGHGYGITAPVMHIIDNTNIYEAIWQVRLNYGVLGQPTFIARGAGYISASAEVDAAASNGYANYFQNGQYIAIRQLSDTPVNGSNVVFDSLPGKVFKLVNTVSLVGTINGSKTAFLQISPQMEIEDAPPNGDPVTLRIRYSQVRLTGHDFLDIGTGNFDDTNYPNSVYGDPVNTPNPANETINSDGGRVFFTATDQDGNFRVGDLFSIEQATGVATLNAEAFNIAGLQELTLGEVTLGGNSASVNEFSTDPFFTANSDSVVPTQRAIKSYIEAQIGGGGASLVINSLTTGNIYIDTNRITSVTGGTINIKAVINFTKSVTGLPLAYNYFLR